MKPTAIPTRHDDPPWFLFFRLDEIAPFAKSTTKLISFF